MLAQLVASAVAVMTALLLLKVFAGPQHFLLSHAGLWPLHAAHSVVPLVVHMHEEHPHVLPRTAMQPFGLPVLVVSSLLEPAY